MALLSPKRRPVVIRRTPEISIRKHIVYGTLALLLFLLLGYGVWYLTRLPAMTLQGVTVSGGETIPHSLVEETVANSLQGNYLFLIPKHFTWLYPEDEVLANVATIARVKDVDVVRDGTTLSVTFTEHDPYALWCGDATQDGKCMFLSEQGDAFAEAPPLRGGALLRFVTQGTEPVQGETPFPPSELASLYAFVDALNTEFNFRVRAVTKTSDGDIYYHLHSGGTLYTSPRMDTETIFENLATVLTSEEFEHITADNFEYIDLRFGNRVFVNEAGTPEPTEPLPPQEDSQYATEPISDDSAAIMTTILAPEEDVLPEAE